MIQALSLIATNPSAGFRLDCPERRKALREREQAQSRLRELELRAEIARDEVRLREKDARICQQELLGRPSPPIASPRSRASTGTFNQARKGTDLGHARGASGTDRAAGLQP